LYKPKLFYRIIFLLVFLSSTAQAQPLTIVVPFSVGGAADNLARTVQQTLVLAGKKSVIVENRPGASGEIAASYVAKHRQGTMLMVASVSLATSNIDHNTAYDLENDLQPIFYFGHMPLVLVTGTRTTINSLTDISNTRSVLSYGSAGIGTSSHLTGHELSLALNRTMTHVPFKGVGQVVPDLVSGNIDVSFLFSSMVVTYTQNNLMKPIAVVSDKRLSTLPHVPTFRELGYENFGFNTWFILLANKVANPQELQDIRAILKDALTDPTKAQPYRNIGLDYTPQDFDRSSIILKREIRRYRQFYQRHPDLR
jgi:tripartite-type tricarboxylate transporter receptor subunit TctC